MTEKHGNGAKMREALEALSAWAKVVINNPKDTTATECAVFIEETIKAALSEPARVCDVLSANELKLQVFAGLAYQIKIKGFNIRGLEELLKSVAGAMIDFAYDTNEEGKTND